MLRCGFVPHMSSLIQVLPTVKPIFPPFFKARHDGVQPAPGYRRTLLPDLVECCPASIKCPNDPLQPSSRPPVGHGAELQEARFFVPKRLSGVDRQAIVSEGRKRDLPRRLGVLHQPLRHILVPTLMGAKPFPRLRLLLPKLLFAGGGLVFVVRVQITSSLLSPTLLAARATLRRAFARI